MQVSLSLFSRTNSIFNETTYYLLKQLESRRFRSVAKSPMFGENTEKMWPLNGNCAWLRALLGKWLRVIEAERWVLSTFHFVFIWLSHLYPFKDKVAVLGSRQHSKAIFPAPWKRNSFSKFSFKYHLFMIICLCIYRFI